MTDAELQTCDERTMLSNYLDAHRALFLRRVEGLTQEQLAVKVASSNLTLAGLIKHLALVEDSWFTLRFAGEPEPEPWASAPFDVDPDWEFTTAVQDNPQALVSLYRETCDRSRAVAAGVASMDALSVIPRRQNGQLFSFRWMMLHMIEETAQHNGHVDLIREQIDGHTGDWATQPAS